MSNWLKRRVNKLNTTLFDLIDIMHKTIEPSHLEKLQIIQNVDKLMFRVIFIFPDWILIKQIIVSSTAFVLGETDLENTLAGVLSGGLGHE